MGLILCAAAGVLAQSGSQGETASVANQADFASGGRLVLLLDTNPHQKKVLPVELALAESVVQKLDQPPKTFSVIVFVSQPPTLLKVGVAASEAVLSWLCNFHESLGSHLLIRIIPNNKEGTT